MVLEENMFTPECPTLQKIVTDELNETPERINECLSHIKDWLSKEPHIKPRLDDKFLLGFLRNSKYSIQKAKTKLDTYFTFRTLAPDFYKNRDPFDPVLKRLFEEGTYLQLPEPHPDGGRVSVTHLKILEDNECTILDLIRVITMINDRISIYDDHLTIAGTHAIVDMKECTMALGTQILRVADKLVLGIQDAYPIRIKYIHLHNFNEAPQIFQLVLKAFKKLFKQKIAERILIHESSESLHEAIPKSILPTEYGGDAGTLKEIAAQCVIPTITKSKEWFEDDAQYKTDESKRIGSSVQNNMFGAEGSFRKLQID